MKALGLAAALLAGSVTPAFCSGYDDLNAGIELHNRGQWDAAIAAFDKALATSDLNIDQQFIAHIDRAQAREGKHDWDGALADFNACVELKPGTERPLLDRALFYLNRNRPDEARRDFDTLIAMNPTDPLNTGLYGYRARTFEIQGNAEKELADLQTEQIQDPKDKDISWGIGIADFQLGKADQAATLFAQSMGGQPGYAWLWLAMADIKQGKPVPADTPSGLGTAKWPHPVIDFFQGHSTEDKVNAAAAQGDARTAWGQACEANFYLGEWRLLHGDRAGAKPLLQKSASDCPRDFVEWPWALAELGNVSQQ